MRQHGEPETDGNGQQDAGSNNVNNNNVNNNNNSQPGVLEEEVMMRNIEAFRQEHSFE